MSSCAAVLQADLTHENWVGVLQQVDIPGGGRADTFLPEAVNLANDRCWGSLSCTFIVDPKTQSSSASAVDKAIADLRYGSVCVNLPSILGYAVMKLAWGGFPGATPQVLKVDLVISCSWMTVEGLQCSAAGCLFIRQYCAPEHFMASYIFQ